MRDNHLENASELLRSVLGQFLEREGYLVKTCDHDGQWTLKQP
jgi:hypothetical protein